MYRSVIAAAIRMLSTHTKVETANLDALQEKTEGFDPHFVICTQPNTFNPGSTLAWVGLSLDRTRPTRICVGGRYSERTTLLGLEELLDIIGDAENFARTQNDRRGC